MCLTGSLAYLFQHQFSYSTSNLLSVYRNRLWQQTSHPATCLLQEKSVLSLTPDSLQQVLKSAPPPSPDTTLQLVPLLQISFISDLYLWRLHLFPLGLLSVLFQFMGWGRHFVFAATSGCRSQLFNIGYQAADATQGMQHDCFLCQLVLPQFSPSPLSSICYICILYAYDIYI